MLYRIYPIIRTPFSDPLLVVIELQQQRVIGEASCVCQCLTDGMIHNICVYMLLHVRRRECDARRR